MIENRLNHRPRKRLIFKSHYEVFYASLTRVALRPCIRRNIMDAMPNRSTLRIFGSWGWIRTHDAKASQVTPAAKARAA
jgi:hypothetical protein